MLILALSMRVTSVACILKPIIYYTYPLFRAVQILGSKFICYLFIILIANYANEIFSHMEFLMSLESIYCQAFKNTLVDGSHNYFVIILCIKKKILKQA